MESYPHRWVGQWRNSHFHTGIGNCQECCCIFGCIRPEIRDPNTRRCLRGHTTAGVSHFHRHSGVCVIRRDHAVLRILYYGTDRPRSVAPSIQVCRRTWRKPVHPRSAGNPPCSTGTASTGYWSLTSKRRFVSENKREKMRGDLHRRPSPVTQVRRSEGIPAYWLPMPTRWEPRHTAEGGEFFIRAGEWEIKGGPPREVHKTYQHI